MRRLLPTLVVTALVTLACGDDGGSVAGDGSSASTSSTSSISSTSTVSTSTSTTTATTTIRATTTATTTLVPVEGFDGFLPDLYVADGTSVSLVGSVEEPGDRVVGVLTTEYPVSGIRAASGGRIVTEEIVVPWSPDDPATDDVRELAVYGADGDRTVVAGREELFDVAVIAGDVSIITEDPRPADGSDEQPGALVAVDVATGDERDIGWSWELISGTLHVDWAAGFWVSTGFADLTEFISFADAAGELDLPSPTADLPYNAPPYVTAGTLSPDGATVWWAEGPDFGFDPDVETWVPMAAEWRVRSMDLTTGEPGLDLVVSEEVLDLAELVVSSLHHTGDHLIVNRATFIYDTREHLPALVVDLTGADPEILELPVHGLATPTAVS